MRTTRCLSEKDRLPDAWVTVPSAPSIVIAARLANRFRVRLATSATLEPPNGGHPGQEITLRVEQDEVGGRTLAVNAAGISPRGSLILNAAAGAVTVWRLLYDEDARLWDAVGVPDLSSLYDAAGAAAAAQAAAQAFATASDATVTTVVKAYADAAVAAHVALPDPHAQYALESALAAVATSGAYSDLTGAPGNQQTFSGAVLSASIVGGQYVVGDGTSGLPSRNALALTKLVVQAQVALALLTSVTVKVVNFTAGTNASVTIVAGETYHRATISLAKAVGDEIGLLVDSVTGAPSAGIFNVYAL